MTFSIAARCAQTGRFGVAISSSSPAVGARCAFVRAGVGAVTSQNVTDPRLGPKALDLLERGASARECVDIIVRGAYEPDFRQLSVVDRNGATALWSGSRSLGVHTEAFGDNVVSAGNLLAHDGVPGAVIAAFSASAPTLDLGERLMRAMEAGLASGGEAGPLHSAALLIADRESWPLTDLRVDWHDAPIMALRDAWLVWQPQMHDYVTRCLNPAGAPSYGVPGD